MRSPLSKLLLVAFIGYAIYAHYLSFFQAKRLIYSDLNPSEIRDGNGSYYVKKVVVDSIHYHGRLATIYYRLTGTYSNGSIKNFPEQQYDNEPTHLEVVHGLLGWKNE